MRTIVLLSVLLVFGFCGTSYCGDKFITDFNWHKAYRAPKNPGKSCLVYIENETNAVIKQDMWKSKIQGRDRLVVPDSGVDVEMKLNKKFSMQRYNGAPLTNVFVLAVAPTEKCEKFKDGELVAVAGIFCNDSFWHLVLLPARMVPSNVHAHTNIELEPRPIYNLNVMLFNVGNPRYTRPLRGFATFKVFLTADGKRISKNIYSRPALDMMYGVEESKIEDGALMDDMVLEGLE